MLLWQRRIASVEPRRPHRSYGGAFSRQRALVIRAIETECLMQWASTEMVVNTGPLHTARK